MQAAIETIHGIRERATRRKCTYLPNEFRGDKPRVFVGYGGEFVA
jgi:hypothetical protein